MNKDDDKKDDQMLTNTSNKKDSRNKPNVNAHKNKHVDDGDCDDMKDEVTNYDNDKAVTPLVMDNDDEKEEFKEELDTSNIKKILIDNFEFDIDLETLSRTKRMYKNEKWIKAAIEKKVNGECIMYWLAVGVQNNYKALLMNLSMAYVRDRIEYELKNNRRLTIDVEEWIDSKSVLNSLLTNIKRKSAKNDLVMAIQAYTGRVCQGFAINKHENYIQDSIKDIALRMSTASHFVFKLFESSVKEICPCQIDFVFALNTRCNVDDDDDGQHSESDDDDAIVPTYDNEDSKEIGDVLSKIKNNKCLYIDTNITKKRVWELFSNIDDDYVENIKIAVGLLARIPLIESYQDYRQIAISHKYDKIAGIYPKNKRVCIFVNRQGNDESVIIFDPPSGWSDLPMDKDLIPESYFNLLNECIIPSDNDDEECINVMDNCKGQLLTLSFHCEQSDDIRCYLFWNGRCLRLYPRDICNILPYCFDQKYKDNGGAQNTLQNIAKSFANIRDNHFEQLYQSLDQNSVPLDEYLFLH